MITKVGGDETVSKGKFASIIGVSPARVSQYLKEGKISRAAIVGDGRSARIRIEQAKHDLRTYLDVGQRFGNGLDTRLEPNGNRDRSPPYSEHRRSLIEVEPAIGIDREIKEQKLEQIRRANRNAAIADAVSRGTLMKTEDARKAMGRIAGEMLVAMEVKLPEVADSLASRFKIPQRDVLHVLRSSFRELRARMSEDFRAKASEHPEVDLTEISHRDDANTAGDNLAS